jgi:hypothetical protein
MCGFIRLVRWGAAHRPDACQPCWSASSAQRLIAIQRLFLDPVTGQRTHRMMLGNSRGGTWPASFAGDTMRIAEGFETACAYRNTGARGRHLLWPAQLCWLRRWFRHPAGHPPA